MRAAGFPARAHRWRTVGKLSGEIVGRVCDCGCGQESIVLYTKDGVRHEVWNNGPTNKGGAGALGRAAAAVELGRDIVGLWERLRKVVA